MFIDYLLSAVLMLITFAIGSSLRFSDFENIFKKSKPLYLGLFLQMVFLPICAFIIAEFSNLPPAEKVGLIIVSICPGGTTSNFISYLIKADTALAVALTAINSLLILFTIPVLSNWAVAVFMGGHTEVSLPIFNMVWEVAKIIIIPAFLGLLFNRFFPNTSLKMRFLLKVTNTILLGIVFFIKFFGDEQSGGSGISVDEIFRLLPATLLMHLSAMTLSYFIALKSFKLPGVQATTISIEVGLQNTALAILVAGTLMGNTDMTKPALVYAIFSFFTTFIFALITIRIRR
jgi:bile acid:sodium symporter